MDYTNILSDQSIFVEEKSNQTTGPANEISLDDLRDPQIRHALYNHIIHILCKINPLHNSSEIFALKNTIYTL